MLPFGFGATRMRILRKSLRSILVLFRFTRPQRGRTRELIKFLNRSSQPIQKLTFLYAAVQASNITVLIIIFNSLNLKIHLEKLTKQLN